MQIAHTSARFDGDPEGTGPFGRISSPALALWLWPLRLT